MFALSKVADVAKDAGSGRGDVALAAAGNVAGWRGDLWPDPLRVGSGRGDEAGSGRGDVALAAAGNVAGWRGICGQIHYGLVVDEATRPVVDEATRPWLL
jgi:hypothetical protein